MIISGTVIAIVVGSLVGAVLVWHHIVNIFASHIIPFFRRTLGDSVADAVASVVSWLDKKVVLARNAIKAVWRIFKEKVLGIKAVYRKTSATTASVETVSTLETGAGQVKRVTVQEESVPLDELPAEIRAQLIRDSRVPASVDMKADVERRASRRATEEGIPAQELDLKV